MKWTRKTIQTPAGPVDAVCPEIISVSRATDVPAYFPKWFVTSFEQGYVRWENPFNQRPLHVAFDKTCAIVFCSKNPAPLLPYLHLFDVPDMTYYFQFTLNDYDEEKFEPNVPPLPERIHLFKRLANRIGKEKVIWRFDPLMLTSDLTVEGLLSKVQRVGDAVGAFTEKLVFSFVDINAYAKVRRNLCADFREFTQPEMVQFAEGLAQLNKRWGLTLATCSEAIDLHAWGIIHNKCIDDQLLLRIGSNNAPLQAFLAAQGFTQGNLFPEMRNFKDPGQRTHCNCVMCKDIGRYNTCRHFCVYCYANTSPAAVEANLARLQKTGDLMQPEP